MKKLFFIFFTFITFTNSSYASFPVSDTLKVEQDILQSEVIKQYHYSLQLMGIDLKSCKCESCRNGVTPLLSKSNIMYKKKEIEIQKEKTELNGNQFVFLSLFSAIGSLIFGFLSLGNAFSHNGSYSSVLLFFILSLISVVGSVILAVKAKKQGVNWGMSMLAVGIAVLSVLFLFPLFFV